MLKNNTLIILLMFPIVIFGQTVIDKGLHDNIIYSKFVNLSQKQLFDTASYYQYRKNSVDTALFCYDLVINSPQTNDPEYQSRIANSLIRKGIIFTRMCDFRNAYRFYIDAMILCEKYDIDEYLEKIYNHLATIYCEFQEYEAAKPYFYKSLSLTDNYNSLVRTYNNLGLLEIQTGNPDSAFYWLNKAFRLCRQHKTDYLASTFGNFGLLYKEKNRFDSAYYYYKSSLLQARKNNANQDETTLLPTGRYTTIKDEVCALSNLANLFLIFNKPDSALGYIHQSNAMAKENHLLNLVAFNYLLLSKYEESKGNITKAFEYYKTHKDISDSVLNMNILNDITQIQRMYEISKTNRQIEQLEIEQKIQESKLYYQRIVWFITLFVLLLVTFGLFFFYLQNKKLNHAYKVLFDKNVKILEHEETTLQKYKTSSLTDNMQNELLDKILMIMNDTSIICNANFTVDKLAIMIESNQFYVSQVINSVLKMNFPSLLNSYRIREAQRLLSLPDFTQKYTIESIYQLTGFGSRSAFYTAFKDVTGVTPKFYLQSVQEFMGPV